MLSRSNQLYLQTKERNINSLQRGYLGHLIRGLKFPSLRPGDQHQGPHEPLRDPKVRDILF